MVRKIAIYIGSRANYSSAKPLMTKLSQNSKIQLLVVVGAAANILKYGEVSKLISSDGFHIDASVYSLVEGETPETMSQSVGLGLIELTNVLKRLSPDIAIAIGDRFDVLPWVIGAAMLNINIAHTMGGERSGTIDESIRHVITKFSNFHFPATRDAYDRIIKMGEPEESVFLTGCPRIDYVSDVINNKVYIDPDFLSKNGGVGPIFKLEKSGFLLVSFHPVTSEYGNNGNSVKILLDSLSKISMPTVMLWPNADAGSNEVSREIRRFREKNNPNWLHLFTNLPIDDYILLMKNCACLIGNSSSAIREGAYIGTPVVDVGSRQNVRERSGNVISSELDVKNLVSSISYQIKNGHYASDDLYGDGNASLKITNILSSIQLNSSQKLMSY